MPAWACIHWALPSLEAAAAARLGPMPWPQWRRVSSIGWAATGPSAFAAGAGAGAWAGAGTAVEQTEHGYGQKVQVLGPTRRSRSAGRAGRHLLASAPTSNLLGRQAHRQVRVVITGTSHHNCEDKRRRLLRIERRHVRRASRRAHTRPSVAAHVRCLIRTWKHRQRRSGWRRPRFTDTKAKDSGWDDNPDVSELSRGAGRADKKEHQERSR